MVRLIFSGARSAVHFPSWSTSKVLTRRRQMLVLGRKGGYAGSPLVRLVQTLQAGGGAHAHPVAFGQVENGPGRWPAGRHRLPVADGCCHRVGFVGPCEMQSLCVGSGLPASVGGPLTAWQGPGKGLIEKSQNQKHPGSFSLSGRGSYRMNVAPPNFIWSCPPTPLGWVFQDEHRLLA
jgi:hypothetical protein